MQKTSKNPDNSFKMPNEKTIEGSISISGKGVGYVRNKEKDITVEIAREALNRAFHGDIVKAEITLAPTPQNDLPQGKVVEIVRRAKAGYSGTLSFQQGAHCVLAEDRMYTNIVIPNDKLSGAKAGDKVFCAISDWADPLKDPTGQVVRVLGKPFENDAEMISFALEKGFDDTYPPSVIREAEEIGKRGILQDEYLHRRDMRQTVTFTIDPEDAKDFDDAISVTFLENGDIELGVHIADVSHYVVPGTALDTEAEKRATSVYLVDRTIPMLPEVLSNELCSLNPNLDRLTFSAIFTIGKDSSIKEQWFGKTVINSHHRYSYESAQAVLDAKEGPYFAELAAALKIGEDLEKKRFAAGAMLIDQEEVRFKLDEKGRPLGVYKKVRGQTHHMIEELMLLANRKVAEFIGGTREHDGDIFVYRVHDAPDVERMHDLQLFLKRLGYDLPFNEDGIISSEKLNELLSTLEGKPEKDTVQTAIVRTMAKAVYSTKNIGHYGLAFKYYTHFTSPIRRYPDTVVHRLLNEYLQHRTVPKELWEYYDRVTLHSSLREKEAADAERASIKYKQVEFMSMHIGEAFDGTITGISKNGLFVEEKNTKCEGMIRLRDLGKDYYEYNEKELAIIGKSSKETFRIGDSIQFKVASADLARRLLDYTRI